MRILIDADSCHVLRYTEKAAKRMNLECHAYCGSKRSLDTIYATVHLTDNTKDAADFAIINTCRKGDLVITPDGGLAAMVLSRNARALSPYGGEYTQEHIQRILWNRYLQSESKRKKHKKSMNRYQAASTFPREPFHQGLWRIINEQLEKETQ